jgi:hypothetical protein
MRTILLAALLLSLASLAVVPGASAGTCDPIRFSPLIDQTGGVACATVDWALVGGPSPVVFVPDYVGCYVFDEPIASWVPGCT